MILPILGALCLLGAVYFLLPLAIGASTGLGGNVVTDAFGVVALVALAPLIAVQIMGVVYARHLAKMPEGEVSNVAVEDDAEIIDLEEVWA